MSVALKLAVAGIGNNISALLQGAYFYRVLADELPEDSFPGVLRARIGGLSVSDIAFVAAVDIDAAKVGTDLADAIFAGPNNYPTLDVSVPAQGVTVHAGLAREHTDADLDQVAAIFRDSGAEVLLYSLPTGLQWAADAYAEVALRAGLAFVNCTPEVVARNEKTLAEFVDAGLPLVGDDLASHLGTSIVHRKLLQLLGERGITLENSYQLNLGGNEDFRNLREHGSSKRQSKLNALAGDSATLDKIEVIASAGYVSHLRDNKVAYLNVEGRGWANTPVSLELRLRVQDSSNAAGVIIDLIRIAAAAKRSGLSGYIPAATMQLKSPAHGHHAYTTAIIDASLAELDHVAV
ncbi:myo-inositol-1-phosphate synthase [Nocardia suismassiliense]|uniref:myo-inositol-1-phosphate synthase n=1 Tax=Nocardia suismassiliense TaxID=2077092 RepID=UPI000D1D6182|nr:myo-inositol-1-phosphate synthase [Nocardia suismassiliense]